MSDDPELRIEPAGRGAYRLTARQWLPCPIDEVFAFFSDARNLQRITPGWLSFRMMSDPPAAVERGTAIDYRIKLRGLPMGWRSEITLWDPPHAFEDVQLCGPYRKWVHRHTFEPCNGGTLIGDRVDYAVPGGRLVHALVVRRDVLAIFRYRQKVLAELFGSGHARG